jgi:hypothetical protein
MTADDSHRLFDTPVAYWVRRPGASGNHFVQRFALPMTSQQRSPHISLNVAAACATIAV